jgi:selenocysteine lyase/cysteine desulfurase
MRNASKPHQTPAGQCESKNARPNWQQVRNMFSFSETKVPMNAANLCPAFEQVTERVCFFHKMLDKDISFQNRKQFEELLELTRECIAQHLGIEAEELALVRNCTEANCIINNGLPLGPDDEVLLWEENHPTNNQAWDIRAKRFGFKVKRVRLPRFPDKQQIVEAFEAGINEKTRLVTFSDISNESGLKLPAKEICTMVHRKGKIWVHIDGAQSWGALNLDLKKMDCDSFSASSHKWFLGPRETGILYVNNAFSQKIWPNTFGYNGQMVVPEQLPPNALRFETLGQRDDAALSGMRETYKLHDMIGVQAIENRVAELATLLKQGLVNIGAKLVTPMSQEYSHGIVVIEVPLEQRQYVADILYKKHGIAGAPTGGLRLSPHIYNTESHIERAIVAVKDVLESFSYQLSVISCILS